MLFVWFDFGIKRCKGFVWFLFASLSLLSSFSIFAKLGGLPFLKTEEGFYEKSFKSFKGKEYFFFVTLIILRFFFLLKKLRARV